jgi:uncharacterized membrane protein
MKFLSRVAAVGWLTLSGGLLVYMLNDMTMTEWRLSWIVFEIGAVLLAFLCGLFLLKDLSGKRPVGIIVAALFGAYQSYLFLIAPPSRIGVYAVLGVSILLLAAVTFVVLLRRQVVGPRQVA